MCLYGPPPGIARRVIEETFPRSQCEPDPTSRERDGSPAWPDAPRELDEPPAAWAPAGELQYAA